MAGGLWKRLKIWGLTEVPTSQQLNAEFDNIKNNFIPQLMSSYSQNISQANIQTAPGATGSEVLPSALSGDVENLRYQLAQIIGDSGGLWRAAPPLSLNQINSLISTPPTNRIVSGRTRTSSIQPMHLVPNGSSNGVTVKCTTTNLAVVINGTKYTFSADIAAGPFTNPPNTQNTATLTNSAMTPPTSPPYVKYDGGYLTKNIGDYRADFETQTFTPNITAPPSPLTDVALVVSSMGTSISNLIGTYQAFMYQHGGGTKEYFIGFVASSTQITKCYRGFFFDSSDNPIVSQAMTSTDTITLMQLTWLYLSSGGVVQASYSAPRYSADAPSIPAIGDYWYDLVNNTWKTWNGSSWVVSNSILIGICIQDGTNTVGARSFDTYRGYASESNVSVDFYSASAFRTDSIENKINLYGTVYTYDKDFLRWDSTNLDSGVTITSGNTYFLYLTEAGSPKVSDKAPYRRWDLGGYYHPHNPWRCVAMVYGNGSNTFDQTKLVQLGYRGSPIHDRSISVSKMKPTQYYFGYQAAAAKDGVVESNSTTGPFSVSAGAGTTPALDGSSNPITCSLVTTGRPVLIMCGDNIGQLFPTIQFSAASTYNINLYRNGVQIHTWQFTPAAAEYLPASILNYLDVFAPAGNNTYALYCHVTITGTMTLNSVSILAMEL